jgi:hypothetical protein
MRETLPPLLAYHSLFGTGIYRDLKILVLGLTV